MSAFVESLWSRVELWWVELSPVVLIVGLGVVLVALVVFVVRPWVMVRSARSDRVEVALVPTSSFDPSVEEVMRWASQLLRVNRVTGRGAPDGARVVRVKLVSMGEGRMVQTVSGPGRAESIIRQTGLSQVEVVDMDGLGERFGGIDPAEPTGQAVVEGSGGQRGEDGGSVENDQQDGGGGLDGGGLAGGAVREDVGVSAVGGGGGVVWPSVVGGGSGDIVWPSVDGSEY